MAEIAVDFKGVVEKSDYEAGEYEFEIVGAESNTGKAGVYIKLKLQFTEGKYAGLLTEEIVSFAQKALFRAKGFLRAVGFDVPDGPIRFRTDDLVTLRFRCHTEREVDPTGKYAPKLRITNFHVPGDGGPTDPSLAPEGAKTDLSTPLAPMPGTAPDATVAAAAPAAPAVPEAPVTRPKRVKV